MEIGLQPRKGNLIYHLLFLIYHLKYKLNYRDNFLNFCLFLMGHYIWISIACLMIHFLLKKTLIIESPISKYCRIQKEEKVHGMVCVNVHFLPYREKLKLLLAFNANSRLRLHISLSVFFIICLDLINSVAVIFTYTSYLLNWRKNPEKRGNLSASFSF